MHISILLMMMLSRFNCARHVFTRVSNKIIFTVRLYSNFVLAYSSQHNMCKFLNCSIEMAGGEIAELLTIVRIIKI